MSNRITTTDIYKPIDDAWIGLLVLAILILILSVGAILALVFLWQRYQRRLQIYRQSQASKLSQRQPVPVWVENYPTTNTNYETQVSLFIEFDAFLS